MKILFAADMSFNYMKDAPNDGEALNVMANTAEVFKSADYSVLNLENIFGNKENFEPIPKSGPNLISNDKYIEFVDALNPTAVGLANNHTLDYGKEAMYHTMKMLSERGYQLFGAGENIEKAYEPAIFDDGDTKVHIIAVCENEFGVATKTSPGTAGYSLTRVKDAIKKAISAGAMPIIYFHGGNETDPFPAPSKTELYRHFVDLGAKAVIAMHTHCPQGHEMYNGCPIIYSMGNFYFPSTKKTKATWSLGYMTMLNITADNCSIEIIPYTFGMDHHTVLDGEQKDKFMEYIEELSEVIDNEDKIFELFEAWCTIIGLGSYLPNVKFDEIMHTDPWKASPVKNIFSCEAHVELMKHTFRIVHEGRVEEAKKLVPYIEKMQSFEV